MFNCISDDSIYYNFILVINYKYSSHLNEEPISINNSQLFHNLRTIKENNSSHFRCCSSFISIIILFFLTFLNFFEFIQKSFNFYSNFPST